MRTDEQNIAEISKALEDCAARLEQASDRVNATLTRISATLIQMYDEIRTEPSASKRKALELAGLRRPPSKETET